MNKRMSALILTGSLVFTAMSLQGCYGRFALTSKLYTWNGTLGNKWVNSVVMVAFNIVPVYPIAMVADGLIFNAVEFWSGKNPIVMGPNEKEIRTVSVDGSKYTVTATQNRLDFAPLQKNAPAFDVKYAPNQKSWFVEYNGQSRKIAEQDSSLLTLLYPDGHHEIVAR